MPGRRPARRRTGRSRRPARAAGVLCGVAGFAERVFDEAGVGLIGLGTSKSDCGRTVMLSGASSAANSRSFAGAAAGQNDGVEHANLCQRVALERAEFGDAGGGQIEQGVETGAGEGGLRPCPALRQNGRWRSSHVHVGVAGGVFRGSRGRVPGRRRRYRPIRRRRVRASGWR